MGDASCCIGVANWRAGGQAYGLSTLNQDRCRPTHGNEMYGTMSGYLRLKGIVPPTTERQNAATKSP